MLAQSSAVHAKEKAKTKLHSIEIGNPNPWTSAGSDRRVVPLLNLGPEGDMVRVSTIEKVPAAVSHRRGRSTLGIVECLA